jgi:quercetin dioxygenase-like cupin family protein
MARSNEQIKVILSGDVVMKTTETFKNGAAQGFANHVQANLSNLAQGGESVERQLHSMVRGQYVDKLVGTSPEVASGSVVESYSWRSLVDTATLKIGLLHLPTGGSIPAHDHPDTVGVSIVLKGAPEVIQADLGQELQPRRKSLKKGELSFIFPQRNNIHGFENQGEPATLLSINISKSGRASASKKWNLSLGLVDQLCNRPGKTAFKGLFSLSLCVMAQSSFASHCAIEKAKAEIEKDQFNKAAVLLDECALTGDDAAQYALGNLYYFGQGVEQDYYTAAQWFQKAANQGNADAQYMYGLMLIEGQGITDDAYEGFEWVFKSMRSGHAEAKKAYEFLLAHPEPLEC